LGISKPGTRNKKSKQLPFLFGGLVPHQEIEGGLLWMLIIEVLPDGILTYQGPTTEFGVVIRANLFSVRGYS
jgi:hypothetical protein